MEFTKGLYSQDGQYSSEREHLHHQIIKEMMYGHQPAAGDPLVIFLGGGTASGKSSLSRLLVQSFKDDNEQVLVIDSDHIKAKLPEYQEWIKKDPERAAAIVHDESSDIANELYIRCMKQKFNVILDGTMKSTEKYLRYIGIAKEEGYTVSAVVADVPLEEAMRRADVRFKIEKRRVPDEIIKQSHEQVPATFHELKERLDSFYLYDTSQRYPIQFYVKQNEQIQVLNENRLNQFYEKAGLSYQEDWTQLQAATLLKDVLKVADGIPTGFKVTADLLNKQVQAYRLDLIDGKETMHYRTVEGQVGRLQLENIPYLTKMERNHLLDKASMPVQRIHQIDFTL